MELPFIIDSKTISCHLHFLLVSWAGDSRPSGIIDRDTLVRDSFVHFFYNCPVTYNLLFQWTRAFVPPPDINSLDLKKLYLYGNDETNNDQSGSLCVVMDIFKYTVWKSKQRRRLPNIISLSREILFILELACAANVSFRHTTGNINLIANLFKASTRLFSLKSVLIL